MTIQEYKDKFAALFKKLQEEHGEVECVHIENEPDSISVEGGFFGEEGAKFYTNHNISVEICF